MEHFDTIDEIVARITKEIEEHITELHGKVREYGPFNVIANTAFRNQLALLSPEAKPVAGSLSVAAEYLSLICLKFPFTLGIREFIRPHDVAEDLHVINELCLQIIQKYTMIHHHRFHVYRPDGTVSDIQHIAQALSSEELLVRNETFESHHWDLLEELYERYDDYFKKELGFTIKEAIRSCITIADLVNRRMQESITQLRTSSQQMLKEILAYKKTKKKPQQFYPQEMLDAYCTWDDRALEMHFFESMATYQMVMMGDRLSFTPELIVEEENLEVETVRSFFTRLSLGFGEINADFSEPEIMHPLKDRPLIRHENQYMAPSLSLLDYSLDRLFAGTLIKDGKKQPRYMETRHDYLMEKGMEHIKTVLKGGQYYTHLKYPGGEMDGLVILGTNSFFIEAKGHRIHDRAKKGYIDRLENHIDDLVKDSHYQATRTQQYLAGNPAAVFEDKQGRKVSIDGTTFHNSFFISLTIESISAISCNLKLDNTLGLFTKETFPWIVSLYDLRVICEHMEGPAYFIQYLHRRKEFFKYKKFKVLDELDLLGYYLKRNLRFDDIIQGQYDQLSGILLESMMEEYNKYYLYEEGVTKKPVQRLKHNSIQPVKTLVRALEESNLKFGLDAAVQLLEFGSKTKKQILDNIATIKKRFKRDGYNHDFRIAGDDNDSGKSWMLSYWTGPHEEGFIDYFRKHIRETFQRESANSYIAILDTGKNEYRFAEILLFTS